LLSPHCRSPKSACRCLPNVTSATLTVVISAFRIGNTTAITSRAKRGLAVCENEEGVTESKNREQTAESEANETLRCLPPELLYRTAEGLLALAGLRR